MSESSLKELKKLKKMAESSDANDRHSFAISLTNNDFEQAVINAIKTYKIEMVVMGTKGATKAKSIFFGSNTVNIVKNNTYCPTLIIPEGLDFSKFEQIAFPTDFKRFYGDELQVLKDLASLYNSKIRIVHVNKEDNLSDAQNYNLAMLKAYLEDHRHSFHWMPDNARKTEEINDFILRQAVDMLVMINYKHSFFESIVNEPIIKNMGFSPKIPFMVIPAD